MRKRDYLTVNNVRKREKMCTRGTYKVSVWYTYQEEVCYEKVR